MVSIIQAEVTQGKAPKGVDRVDKGKIKGEKDHVHFKDGTALNKDGTWKHDGKGEKTGGRPLTKEEKAWLESNGWSVPSDSGSDGSKSSGTK